MRAARFLTGAPDDSAAEGAEAAVSVEVASLADSVFGFLSTVFVRIVRDWIIGHAVVCKRIFAKRLRPARLFAYGAAVRHFVFRWLITTVTVMAATWIVPGISVDGTGPSIGAAFLLGILNAFVRPVLLLLSAPLILLSLGLFILVLNALMLSCVPMFVPGFRVESFNSAFWGAIVIGIVSWMLSAFFRGSDGRVHVLTHHAQIKQVQGRVVDPKEGKLE